MLPPIDADIQGLIFDCDGTLADTMPLHLRAWQAMMSELGGTISREEFYELAGVPTRRMIELLNKRHGTAVNVDTGARLKEELYGQIVHGVEPIAIVADVARAYAGKLPIAVASGGELFVVKQTLTTIGLFDIFDAIVTADDVVHGKPAPDIFLEAARRIGIDPDHCLVFEDADAGITAAVAAGMRYVDVRRHLDAPAGVTRAS